MSEPRADRPSRAGRAGAVVMAYVLATSLGAPLILFTATLLSNLHQLAGLFGALAVGIGALVLAVRMTKRRPAWARLGFEIVVLLILPVWGLCYSHFLGYPYCEVGACTVSEKAMRPFHEPEVFALAALHVATALAYLISRRRPEALVPRAEALLHGLLVAGVIVQALVAVHVGRWMIVAVLIAPVFLPVAGPVLTVGLYAIELHARLVQRGIEAGTPKPFTSGALYRESRPQEPLPGPPQVHRPGLWRALAAGPALLGVYGVLHALLARRPGAALEVLTQTCGHVLSQVPIQVMPEKCHYLCTVAARGHAWLVRPERLGVRGGVVIVVNRQLAMANAFEDLLHERWPRFGALARRVYDRVGRPICRYLQRPVLADLVYLAMKPAEWGFYVALLLLDRGDPEARVGRMYRG